MDETSFLTDQFEAERPRLRAVAYRMLGSLSDAVELALLLVLDALTPAERLAFVLHDVFAVPFDEIAPIVQRSPEATRQLASRARRRVRGAREGEPDTDADPARRRAVVDAFL